MWILFRTKMEHIHTDFWTCIKSKDRCYFAVIGRYEISRNVVINSSDCLALLFRNRSADAWWPQNISPFFVSPLRKNVDRILKSNATAVFALLGCYKVYVGCWLSKEQPIGSISDVSRHVCVPSSRQTGCPEKSVANQHPTPIPYLQSGRSLKPRKPHPLSSTLFSVHLSQRNHSKLNNPLDIAS